MVVLWRGFVVVVGRVSATGTIRYRYTVPQYAIPQRDAKLASAQRKRAARVHLDSFLAAKKNLQERPAFLAFVTESSLSDSETLHRYALRGSIAPTNTTR